MQDLQSLLPPDFELDDQRDIEVVQHPSSGMTTAWPQKGTTVRLYLGQFPNEDHARAWLRGLSDETSAHQAAG